MTRRVVRDEVKAWLFETSAPATSPCRISVCTAVGMLTVLALANHAAAQEAEDPAEPQPVPAPATEAKPTPLPDANTAPDPTPNQNPNLETETETDPDPEPDPEPEPDTDADPTTDPSPTPSPTSIPTSIPTSTPEPDTDTNTDTHTETEPDKEIPAVSETASSTEPVPPAAAGPFARHRVRIGGTVGWTAADQTDWIIAGASAGYFVIDGLEASAGGMFWLFGDPFLAAVTPGLRYVFYQVPQIKPYLGTFYRHYFVTDNSFGWSDSDSVGGRLGIIFMTGASSYFAGGLAYERLLDDNLFEARDQFYPEITFAFTF